jgi:hypothetical protein
MVLVFLATMHPFVRFDIAARRMGVSSSEVIAVLDREMFQNGRPSDACPILLWRLSK